MKLLSSLSFVLFTIASQAQFLSPQEPKPELKPIKASDPTQLYTTLNMDVIWM